MILQLDIFDFDQTLFETPEQKEWEKIYNKKWVNQDFYESPKSLLKPLKVKPNNKIVNKFLLSSVNPFIFTVIMTGRTELLKPYISKILENYKLFPNELILRPAGKNNTLEFKSHVIKNFLNEFKNLKKVRFFDDRIDHIIVFEKIVKNANLECEIFPIYNKKSLKKFLSNEK